MDGKAWLNHNFEYSFLRFRHRDFKFKSTNIAVEEYLKLKELEGLDGLKIDWQL